MASKVTIPFNLLINWADLHSWGSGAIALISGFLFGVTYRYIIRQDQNSHLKSGAVLAFALIRGLAWVDAMDWSLSEILGLVLPVGESVVLFAIAQLALDQALQKGLIKAL